MARGTQPISLWAGRGAVLAVLALTLGPLAAVLWRADGIGRLGPADWAAVRFTLVQAALSAALSVALAVPVARALARQDFPGRRLVVTLLGAPFILPVIVAVLGLLMVFGQSGWLAALAAGLGLPAPRIYGLHGVVLAHVFFNLPLATRFFLQGWQAVPAERFRLAAALDLSPARVRRLIEPGLLREIAPGAFLVIFLVCTTSFAVALILGGGPRATTIELAIYQAFRFEFDLGKAALLGLVQVAIAGAGAALALRLSVPRALGAGLDRPPHRWDAAPCRLADAGWIALAVIFLALPLVALVVRGAPGLAELPGSLLAATLRSLGVALASAALCVGAALAIARLAVRRGNGVVEALGYLSLAISPLVIGTGLFILLFPLVRPGDVALPVTALVNALMALPFAVRALVPAVREIETDFRRLADSLDLSDRVWTRRVLLPRLRAPLGFAAGVAAALSAGDLGVIALFADPQAPTLPLAMWQLMGAYRMDAAAGAALVLLALSLGLFWLFDRGGRIGARA